MGGSALLALAKGLSELRRERFHSPDDLQICAPQKICPGLVLGDLFGRFPKENAETLEVLDSSRQFGLAAQGT